MPSFAGHLLSPWSLEIWPFWARLWLLFRAPSARCSVVDPGGQGGNQTTSINTSLRAWPRHIPEAPSRRRRQLRASSTIKSFETEQPSTGQKRTRTRNQLPRTLEHSLHRQPTSPTPLHWWSRAAIAAVVSRQVGLNSHVPPTPCILLPVPCSLPGQRNTKIVPISPEP